MRAKLTLSCRMNDGSLLCLYRTGRISSVSFSGIQSHPHGSQYQRAHTFRLSDDELPRIVRPINHVRARMRLEGEEPTRRVRRKQSGLDRKGDPEQGGRRDHTLTGKVSARNSAVVEVNRPHAPTHRHVPCRPFRAPWRV
jgi:hypothetical protein